MFACEDGLMLELAILGFLAEGPLPGHELRRRVSQLTGYTRPVSDGSLYPAINRLTRAGLIERRADPARGGALPPPRATSRAERPGLRDPRGEDPPVSDGGSPDSDPHAPAAPAS